jgi:hypothetical protein
MNIEDKAALFAEAHRVLAPGGVFALKDAVRQTADREQHLCCFVYICS